MASIEGEGREVEENWNEFSQSNRTISPHPSRKDASNNVDVPLCLRLKSLDGVPLPRDIATDLVEFQVRLNLYDASNKWFLGSTCLCPLLPAKEIVDGRARVPYNEPLYFHSNLCDYSIIAVIEITIADKNISSVVGWTILRLFSSMDKLIDTSASSKQNLPSRIPVYSGTASSLFLIAEPIEEFPSLDKIPDFFVSYTLYTHTALTKVVHLIPENVFICGDDIIPGVSEVGAQTASGAVDILRRPKLLPKWPCVIRKLSLFLYPSIDWFEESLCTQLNAERIIKAGTTDDGSVVSIAERKLIVTIHNGWTFVHAPHVGYLEKEYAQGTVVGSPQLTPKSKRECRCLVLKSQLELDDLVDHPLFAVVFQLEYVVNIPVIKPDIPTNKRARARLGSSYGSIPLAQKQNITLRWTLWVPFEKGPLNRTEMSLDLQGGHSGNPVETFTFSKHMSIPQDAKSGSLGKINFTFLQTNKVQQAAYNRFQSMGAESSIIEGTVTDSNASLPYNSSVSPSFKSPLPPGSTRGTAMGKPPIPGRSPGSFRSPAGVVQEQVSYEVNQYPRYQQYLGASMEVPVATLSESADLTELPHVQPYTPIIAEPGQHTMSQPRQLSRAAYAQLHGAGFPSLTDSLGNPPFTVDPAEYSSYDLESEDRDSLKGNEVTIQFLAMSRCNRPTVFFTFQFYRFPQVSTERLCIKGREDDSDSSTPYVLQRCSRDGKPLDVSPGLQLKYTLDPAFMQPGERRSFLKYLVQQTLYIDVWDGDSLMLVGSCSVEMKHLLRQGHTAVQVYREIDVLSVSYSDEQLMVAGDLGRIQAGMPPGMQVSLAAKLFIRLGNVGSTGGVNPEKAGTLLNTTAKTHIVSSNTVTSPMSLSGPRLKTVSRAKLMAERDAELATALVTRKTQNEIGKNTRVRSSDAERARKLERMRAVREHADSNGSTDALMVQKEEKMQRTRDLKTIQLYREKLKHEGIKNILEDSITTEHTLYTSLGVAEFFEFALRNPYSVDQTIQVNIESRELSLISDSREWRYFKQISNIRTPVEEDMCKEIDSVIQFYIKANELVQVPFKYQCFSADASTPETGPAHPLQTRKSYVTQAFGHDTGLRSKHIKVSFVTPDQKPIAILSVHVEIQPHAIDQTYRFYNMEQSFLKKQIRLPPLQSLSASLTTDPLTTSKISARSTDIHVITSTTESSEDEPATICIKVPCGPSPAVKRFFVIIYIDNFCSVPCQIWQFYVHSLQRVDLSAVFGETTRCSVIVKGGQSSRMVKCFSSHHEELEVKPADPFMLMANSIQEIGISVKPPSMLGRKQMFVNVVDVEFHQLVKSWLINVAFKEPHISKSFESNMKLGKSYNKRFPFLNQYAHTKAFIFRSSRQDIIHFKEESILLGSGQSHNIGFTVLPQQMPFTVDIYIFIQNKQGNNEDTFLLRANFTSCIPYLQILLNTLLIHHPNLMELIVQGSGCLVLLFSGFEDSSSA